MRLSEWCAQQGEGAKTRLARACDVRWATIHDIVEGRSKPQPETARRIEHATEGAVTAAELLGLTVPGGGAAV
jgi:DNA-binding transcriptional regulator YdaS (Cro superfamily)